MAALMQRGVAYLYSHAILENRRVDPEEPDIVYVDALVLPSVANAPPVICSLCRVQKQGEDIAPGMYTVYAKVCSVFLTSPPHRTMLTVCLYTR